MAGSSGFKISIISAPYELPVLLYGMKADNVLIATNFDDTLSFYKEIHPLPLPEEWGGDEHMDKARRLIFPQWPEKVRWVSPLWKGLDPNPVDIVLTANKNREFVRATLNAIGIKNVPIIQVDHQHDKGEKLLDYILEHHPTIEKVFHADDNPRALESLYYAFGIDPAAPKLFNIYVENAPTKDVVMQAPLNGREPGIRCAVCRRQANFECSGCGKAYYCGERCQTVGWKVRGHQNKCEG